MRDNAKSVSTLRLALASTSLALLVSAASVFLFLVLRLFGPRNLLGTTDNPLIGILLALFAALLAILTTVAGCLFGLLTGGALWLILMKPFFTASELNTVLGLDIGKQNSVKRLVKRVFNLIY